MRFDHAKIVIVTGIATAAIILPIIASGEGSKINVKSENSSSSIAVQDVNIVNKKLLVTQASMNYEYKTETFSANANDQKELALRLNDASSEGWEYYDSIQVKSDFVKLIYRRPRN
jgi:hypothetical protein